MKFTIRVPLSTIALTAALTPVFYGCWNFGVRLKVPDQEHLSFSQAALLAWAVASLKDFSKTEEVK